MTESNPTQVILTDDGIKIIKAQKTADKAASGVTNLNDPNLMSVIEKQYNIAQFAGLASQFNVIIQNAKDDGIDTTAVTTAYNNLNQFMADILADPDHASDVDRATYKKYQDAYNEELANIQNALQNSANNKFTSAASAASQAAIATSQAFSAADSAYNHADSEIAVQSNATAKAQNAADSAFSQAQAVGSQADSAIAVQSAATAKAQSTADNAFSQAQEVGSQASAEISSNSTATAKAQNAADSAFNQAKTAIDNGQVTSEAVTALKDGSTLTIAQLGSGLATKVSNSEYASYKTQTASEVAQMVTSGAFTAYSQATAELISEKVATSDFSSYKDQTARAISSKVESQDFNTYKTQTADLISAKVATKDFASYQDETAKAISSKVESSDFNTYKLQTADTITSKVATKDFDSYKTQTANDINLRVEKKGLIDEINLQAGNTLISSSGQLTLSGKNINFDTTNPVIISSANIDTILVKKTLTAADISANTFSTNNGTFTVDKNGAITAKNMTINDGTLTSPTINASTINGATINGTTFHGGDIINDANNTSKFYPTTISSNGHIYTTWFTPIDAFQTDLSIGSLTTKYRHLNTTDQNNRYDAFETTIEADQISLVSGYTDGKDTSFTQPLTTSNRDRDGYVLLSPLNGLTLQGNNQQITFNGTSDDVTPKGIFITPYGNINPNGTQNIWYVGNNAAMKTAQFGIDGSGTYGIKFNRSLNIGNFSINTAHTITSTDGGPIYFYNGKNGAADIRAGTVKYDSLVKSSLLSIKKDVRKADTAYWAQLVNSIDLATYQYKTDDNTSHIRLSSIVDDVNDTKQWQLPDVFISRNEDGKLCGVDDSVLMNATLATVQEQQKEIDQLNGHNMELEARLNKLEAKLNG